MNNPATSFELAMAAWILKAKLPSVLTPLIFEYVHKESDFAKEVASLIQSFRYATCYEPSIEAFLFRSFLEPQVPIGKVMKVSLRGSSVFGNLNGKNWGGHFIHADGYNLHQREVIGNAMLRKTWSPDIVPDFETVEDQCLAALVAGRSYDYPHFRRALRLFFDLKDKAPLVTLIVAMFGNERNYKMLPFGFIRDPSLIRLVSKTVAVMKDIEISKKFVEYLEDPRGPHDYRRGHVELKRHREALDEIEAEQQADEEKFGFSFFKRRRCF